jgi:hypothetical protein
MILGIRKWYLDVYKKNSQRCPLKMFMKDKHRTVFCPRSYSLFICLCWLSSYQNLDDIKVCYSDGSIVRRCRIDWCGLGKGQVWPEVWTLLFKWGIFGVRKTLPASQYGVSSGYKSRPLPSTHPRSIFYIILTGIIPNFMFWRVETAPCIMKQISESRVLNCD